MLDLSLPLLPQPVQRAIGVTLYKESETSEFSDYKGYHN
jgi:hypothetical protein